MTAELFDSHAHVDGPELDRDNLRCAGARA
jgi:hypothetical protein